jgi:Skp family chaperone for outer membrane proteins
MGIWMIAAAAIFLIGAPLRAQDGAKPTARAVERVGVVNLSVVYAQYVRVQEFNAEIGQTLEPYRKARAINSPDRDWPSYRPTDQQYADLARLKGEVEKLVDEKYADKKATIKKEINFCAQKVAEAFGYKVVLFYGVPEIVSGTAFARYPFGEKTPSFEGGLVPLYIARDADLTEIVVHNLNAWAREEDKKRASDNGEKNE